MIESGSHGNEDRNEAPRPGVFRAVTRGISERLFPPVDPRLLDVKEEIMRGENPIFEDTSGVIVEEYRPTRRTDSYLRVRNFRDGIETSYIARVNPESGEAETHFEGAFRAEREE